MVVGRSEGLRRLTAITSRCQIVQIEGLTSASSRMENSRKNISRRARNLPQVTNSSRQHSQKGSVVSVMTSDSSSSFAAAESRRKRNDEQLLAGRLSKISLHNGSISRKLSSRISPLSVEGVAGLIQTGIAKNIVVMVGAGISTPSGIPDFRSPGTGLYDNLKQYKIPYPEAIFDIEYFRFNPRPFFTLAKELYPNGKYRPNLVHHFLRLLHDKGVLLRLYTQNIDGLERSAGIPSCKLVEAHGTFITASCTRCHQRQPSEDVRAAIFSDKIPRCYDSSCHGIVKPDIVFFGEDLPKRFYLYNKDFHKADLLLVLGTSLEVEPFAGIVDTIRSNVPRLLINRDLVGPFRSKLRRESDIAMIGDITEQVKTFAGLLDSTKELEKLMSESPMVVSQGSGGEVQLDRKDSGGCDKTGDLPTIAKDEKPHKTRKTPDDIKKDRQENKAKSHATSNSDNKQRSSSGGNAGSKKKPTAFHAQRELFRSSKAPSDSSDSSDSLTSSSDEDNTK